MSTVNFLLSVKPSHRSQQDDVRDDIQSLGAVVEQNLSSLGIMTGSVSKENFEKLKAVSGVEHVEIEKEVR